MGSRTSSAVQVGDGILGISAETLSPFLRSYKDFFPVFKLPHPSSLSRWGPACWEAWSGGAEGQPCALVALGRALRPCLLCAHLCILEEEGVTQLSVW